MANQNEHLRNLDREINFARRLKASDTQCPERVLEFVEGINPASGQGFVADFVQSPYCLNRLDPINQYAANKEKLTRSEKNAVTRMLFNYMAFYANLGLTSQGAVMIDPIETSGIYQVLARDVLAYVPSVIPDWLTVKRDGEANYLTGSFIAVQDSRQLYRDPGFNYYSRHFLERDLYGQGNTLWLKDLSLMIKGKHPELAKYLHYDRKNFKATYCVPKNLYKDSFRAWESQHIKIEPLPFDFYVVPELAKVLTKQQPSPQD